MSVLFFILGFISGRTTQWLSTEPNTVSFVELPVFASAVDLVRMNRCRPMPLTASVFVNLIDQVSRLVEVFKTARVHHDESIFHTEGNFGSKFIACVGLASKNRPDVGLSQADDS